MKSQRMVWFLCTLVFTGCVSISKYNKAIDANTMQRHAIEKLGKRIKTLEQRNQEMKDSLRAYSGVVLSLSVAGKNKTVTIKRDAAVEFSNDSFQSDKEKAVLYYMNYARAKPQEFLKKYVLPNLRDTSGYYQKSLLETLRKMKPVGLLKANATLYGLAYCHAKASGITGYVGHGRKNESCNIKGRYSAECCAYGRAGYSSDEALNYVLQLLVDEGVPSLGHRDIILMEWLTKAGVSIQPHKTYGENVVIDFGRGN